jgi:hypothetical protein
MLIKNVPKNLNQNLIKYFNSQNILQQKIIKKIKSEENFIGKVNGNENLIIKVNKILFLSNIKKFNKFKSSNFSNKNSNKNLNFQKPVNKNTQINIEFKDNDINTNKEREREKEGEKLRDKEKDKEKIKKNSEILFKNNQSQFKNDNKNEKILEENLIIEKEKINKKILAEKEVILIYSQQTGLKYYYYNILFLGGYCIYSWICIYQQIPEPLYSTVLFFGLFAHILFIGCFMLSNRQIKNIYTNKTSDKFLIQTFSFLRPKLKNIVIEPGFIYAVKTNKYLRKMNLFYITFTPGKYKLFNVFNFLVFRPHNTTQMFDKIFKPKLNNDGINKINKKI